MQKIHANELHAKLGHPGEYRILTTAMHLYYSINGTLEVCEDCTMEKSSRNCYIKWRRSAD